MQSIRHLLENKKVLAVEAHESVHSVARYMSEHVIGAVPVLERGRLVGMFTERDLMTRVVVPGRDPVDTPVMNVMTTNVVVAEPQEHYTRCIGKMKKVHCRHLPVVENGRLLGTISLRDLLVEDIKERAAEVQYLTEYVGYTPPAVETHTLR